MTINECISNNKAINCKVMVYYIISKTRCDHIY